MYSYSNIRTNILEEHSINFLTVMNMLYNSIFKPDKYWTQAESYQISLQHEGTWGSLLNTPQKADLEVDLPSVCKIQANFIGFLAFFNTL